jgi:HlyD family secretion protein
MNPTTVQSVVTYDTIIEFANPELKLFPGMTAYVTIPVATAQNVLKLPNTALRYRPPVAAEEVLALYKRYGIEEGEGQRGAGQTAGTDSTAESGALARSAAQNAPRAPKAETAVVWKLHPDNSMEPVKVSLGITDHAYTEASAILKGDLKEGDDVIIRSVTSKTPAPSGIRR